MKMHIRDYYRLAFRSIMRQKFRSLLAVLAVVIGAASITLMLSLVTGARDYYFKQFESGGKLEQVVVSPQTNISFEESQLGTACDSCVKLTDEVGKEILGMPDVTGLAPTANVTIFETIGLGSQTQLANSAVAYQPNGVIQHTFIAGSDFTGELATNEVVIGQTYADKWGYKGKYNDLIGKEVVFTTNRSYTGVGATLPDPVAQFKQCQSGTCQSEDLIAQLKSTELRAKIVGVESDEPNSLFLPMAWAEQLLQSRYYEITPESQASYALAFNNWVARGRVGPEPMPEFTLITQDQLAKNGYTTFVVRADNRDNTDAVAAEIRKLGVGAVTAQQYIQNQLEIFNIISLILGAMGGIALFVAALGVINIMVMAVLERTREIGVMRAVGAKRSNVSRLFTLEASLLGFFGGVLGVLVGYGLIGLANIFINIELNVNGAISRNIIGLPPVVALGVIIAATLIGMFAGLYPARRAAKLDPVEALRHV